MRRPRVRAGFSARRSALGRLRAVGSAILGAKWGLAATVLAYVTFLAMFLTTPVAQTPGSDGHYTWLYARSIVFDHDLDFTNDYAVCGDPYKLGALRGTPHPDNPFYVGPSVAWAPVLWTLRHVIRLPANAPEEVKQACRGPLAGRTLWTGTLLGALTLWLMYRIARRVAGDAPATFAAGILGFGTSLPAYAAILPDYSHVHDAFWAGITVLTSLRAAERPKSLMRWALAGIAVGIGLLQRPVSVLYGIVPAVLAIQALRSDWRRAAAAIGVLGAGALVFGAVPQMLVYRYLYGAWWIGAPAGRNYLHYAHAHPWLVLFAPHGGLFFAAPVVWLAVPGAILALRDHRRRALGAALLVACAATVWVSSAPLDWHGNGTFGARRLTSLLALLVTPVALTVDWMRHWLRSRPGRSMTALGLGVLGTTTFTIVGASYGLGRGDVTTETGLSQADLYGRGTEVAWRTIDERIGDLAILPAELAFAARYGLRTSSFRDATEPLYKRDFRTLNWEKTEIDFAKGDHRNLVTGFTSGDDGLHMNSRRATFVFAAEWPFATHVSIVARAECPAKVHVGSGRALGEPVWYGDFTPNSRKATFVVLVPHDGFDSGIQEIVFDCPDEVGADVVVESIKIEDKGEYGPAL